MWEKIKGFDNYEINESGEVRSLNFNKTGEIKLRKLHRAGRYLYVTLNKRGVIKSIRVNRLVAQAFLGLDISDKSAIVLHNDNNPYNNHVSNLRLGTYRENTEQCINDGRFITHKSRRSDPMYHEQTRIVFEMRENGCTYKEISDELGISKSYACLIVKGLRRVYQTNFGINTLN